MELIERTHSPVASQLLVMLYREYSHNVLKGGHSKLPFSGYGEKYHTALSFILRVRRGATATNYDMNAQGESWEHCGSFLRHIELAKQTFALTSRNLKPLVILESLFGNYYLQCERVLMERMMSLFQIKKAFHKLIKLQIKSINCRDSVIKSSAYGCLANRKINKLIL